MAHVKVGGREPKGSAAAKEEMAELRADKHHKGHKADRNAKNDGKRSRRRTRRK